MSLNHDSMPEPDQHGDLFVEFANTLEFERGQPVDGLPDTDALLAWLRDHELLSDPLGDGVAERLGVLDGVAKASLERGILALAVLLSRGPGPQLFGLNLRPALAGPAEQIGHGIVGNRVDHRG